MCRGGRRNVPGLDLGHNYELDNLAVEISICP